MPVGDTSYVLVTQFLTVIRASVLKKPVANLVSRYDAIRSAMDMIFLGF